MTRPLGRWYAAPMDPAAARTLLARAERRQQAALRRGGRCRLCPLLVLVARFWLGHPVDGAYHRARRALDMTPRGRALTELVYGQLLASRRLGGADHHLRAGFRRAVRLFAADDYLRVMHRHQSLSSLPTGPRPSPPEDLPGLLRIAEVTARLQAARPALTAGAGDPCDLHG